jgi:hypothetical protein
VFNTKKLLKVVRTVLFTPFSPTFLRFNFIKIDEVIDQQVEPLVLVNTSNIGVAVSIIHSCF